MDRHPETEKLPSGSKHLLCLNWSLQTWVDEIEHETGVKPHPRNAARLGAALALLTSPDEFYLTQTGFTDIVLGLSAGWFDGNTHGRHASLTEIAVGLAEAHLIAPPDDTEKLAPSVVRLINATAKQEGYGRLPKILKSFGVPVDPAVSWTSDLSDDPLLADISVAGYDDREGDIDQTVRGYLSDIADNIAGLPLRHLDVRPIAERLRAFATGQ